MLAIFARFLRFGLLAWGGPVAQIAMLRRELVEEERWVTSERFNKLLAVYQVLPGPEAHELAVHLGMLRGGRLGGLLAGLGFMLPGFLLVLIVAGLYVSIDLGQPALAAALLGVQVAVVALVLRAVERIGRHVLVDPWAWSIALSAAILTLGRVPFWIVLPLAGLAYAVIPRLMGATRAAGAVRTLLVILGIGALAALVVALAGGQAAMSPGVPTPGEGAPGGVPLGGAPSAAGSPTDASLLAIVVAGLKAGLLTFGGAYTAIPFVRDDAVGGGWISEPEFLDSLALSGILPAPLIIFGTFVGFLAGGLPGALAMTVGIFLPAFAFSLVLGDRLEAVVERPGLHRFLQGVAAAVVGVIAITALDLGAALAGRVPSLAGAAVILVVALMVLLRWRSRAAIPATITLGAVLGLVLLGSPAAGALG